jgi:type I restriction enzyme S subunit
MNANQAKYPQLRFKGFTDPWEERKLGEISRMYQPLTITGNDLLPDGVPVFGANGFIGFFSEANHIDDQVTISARGEGTGTPSYVHGPVWITGNSMVVNVGDFDIDKYFLFANLTANSLKKYVTGGAQPQLTRDVLVKVPITLPNTDEQKKIGAFFKQLDDTITLHQRKLAKLKELKQGYLQKMFPQNGSKFPQLRFAGFADAWEQRKLTEIVNRVNKSSNSDVLPKVEFEDIVSGEGRLNKDISSKLDSRKGTLFESENILYGKLRPYLKNWLFPDFEGVALGDFWVFEATDVSVPSFDYYLIQSDDYQKVANDTSGTKMPRSDWKNVSSTDFAIPSKDEQKQIGTFFKQLDNTITLHQRKLEKLQELKKGYLQKMFC